MLYLVRKINQAIVINNDIQIKIIETHHNSVKLGITYPKGCTILRKEVFDSIAERNIEALKSFDEYNAEKN